MRQRITAVIMVLAISTTLSACGSGDGATDPPAAVASVSVTSPATILVPQQTLTLTASIKDAAGNSLTDRPIAWASENASIATVNTNGVVTGVATGSTTISATSEGKTGTLQIAVTEGQVIGPNGGTVTFANNTIRLVFPVGAVTTNTPISITQLDSPRQTLPAGWSAIGKMFALAPGGTTFAKPVSVTITYDATQLPAWSMTGDLGVLHLSGSNWDTLTSTVVDTAARTVSGHTTSFSDVGLAVEDPEIVLTPSSGQVNATHRSVELNVALAARGKGIAGKPYTQAVMYRWHTSGNNGALSGAGVDTWSDADKMQYTATNAQLDQLSGKIDDVTVDVLLNPDALTDPQRGPVRFISSVLNIDADLDRTYDLTPDDATIGAGATANIHLVARNKAGQTVALPESYHIKWSSTNNYGTLSPLGDLDASYTSNTVFDRPPPRVERITATIIEQVHHQVRFYKATILNEMTSYEEELYYELLRAEPTATVNVKVNYTVSLAPSTRTLNVGENVILGATLDPPYNGPGIRYRFSRTGTHGTIDVVSSPGSDGSQVRFTALNGIESGDDIVKVDVDAVNSDDVVMESIGSAQSRLTVMDDTVHVYWRFTSFTGPTQYPPDSVFHISTSAYFEMFKAVIANPSSGYFYSGPYLHQSRGELKVFGLVKEPEHLIWFLNYVPADPSCAPAAFPDSRVIAGNTSAGTLKGSMLLYCSATFDNPPVYFKTMWIDIDATKSGITLHGTIRMTNQNVIYTTLVERAFSAILLPPHEFEYTFTATRSPPP